MVTWFDLPASGIKAFLEFLDEHSAAFKDLGRSAFVKHAESVANAEDPSAAVALMWEGISHYHIDPARNRSPYAQAVRSLLGFLDSLGMFALSASRKPGQIDAFRAAMLGDAWAFLYIAALSTARDYDELQRVSTQAKMATQAGTLQEMHRPLLDKTEERRWRELAINSR